MSHAIAVLPYLKTSGRIAYRGLEFRNSDDRDGLEPDILEHVRKLSAMFFLRDNLQIKNVTLTVLTPANDADIRTQNRRLMEFQALVTYMYSAPHPSSGDPFLRAEHGSLFVFQPKAISHFLISDEHTKHVGDLPPHSEPDEWREVPGYEGYLNGRCALWVTTCSRIYPPTPRIWFNLSQDLHIDLGAGGHGPYTRLLFDVRAGRDDAGDLDERILTALRWYNRSIACDVEDDLAVASLAIAFEALLGLERGEKVTARFRQAVTFLLGPVPRLDSWLEQFYDARSDIMHDGRSERLMFRAVDLAKSGKPPAGPRYRELASYGRHIFQSCLTTILSGMQAARRIGLSSLLQSNTDRFTKIIRELDSNDVPPAARFDRIANLVDEVATYRFVPEEGISIDTLVAATRRAATVFVAAGITAPEVLLDAMRELSTIKQDPDHIRALSTIRLLHDGFDAIPERIPGSPLAILASLVDSVWAYTFREYYLLEQNSKTATLHSEASRTPPDEQPSP